MQVVIVVEGAVRWKITGAAGQLRERLAPISPTCAVALFGAKQVVQPCIDRLQFCLDPFCVSRNLRCGLRG